MSNHQIFIEASMHNHTITAATITSADCWIYKIGELWKSKLSKS